MTTRRFPTILFVCVHNAGRSQMAAAFARVLSEGRVDVRSAGTAPAAEVNPAVVTAMAEVGVDLSEERPKILEAATVEVSDVVITMGCGDTCPFYPGVTYLDWEFDDPAGHPLEDVRPIRGAIASRVSHLLNEMGVTS